MRSECRSQRVPWCQTSLAGSSLTFAACCRKEDMGTAPQPRFRRPLRISLTLISSELEPAAERIPMSAWGSFVSGPRWILPFPRRRAAGASRPEYKEVVGGGGGGSRGGRVFFRTRCLMSRAQNAWAVPDAHFPRPPARALASPSLFGSCFSSSAFAWSRCGRGVSGLQRPSPLPLRAAF